MYRYFNNQSEEEFRKAMLQVRDSFQQQCNTEKEFAFYYTNGYDHDILPVVTQESPDDITWMKWGLVPNKKRGKSQMEEHLKLPYSIHANEEGLNTSLYTMDSVAQNRCLIPAMGFFVNRILKQWNFMAREDREEKYPYSVQLLDFNGSGHTMPFFFAGLYNLWKDEQTNHEHLGFLMLMVKSWENELMSKFSNHQKNSDRMPCILTYDQCKDWLDPNLETEAAEEYLYAFEAEWMQAYSVSRKLNEWNGEHNRPESILYHPYKDLEDETKLNSRYS